MADDSVPSSHGDPTDADLRPRVEGQVARPPAFHTIGTVEGEFGGLDSHGGKQFLLYDRLAGQKIVCYGDDSVTLEDLRDLSGKRIAVTGEIRSGRSGERVSINVSSVYVFPRKEDLPSPDEVRGLLRNAD